jgi:Ca2+-binding EF-hand superfamily protein
MHNEVETLLYDLYKIPKERTLIQVLSFLTFDTNATINLSNSLFELLFTNFDHNHDGVISHETELDAIISDLRKAGLNVTREQWVRQSSGNSTDIQTMTNIINNSFGSYQQSCCDHHDHDYYTHKHDLSIYTPQCSQILFPVLELFELHPTGSVYQDMIQLVDASENIALIHAPIVDYFFDKYDTDKDAILNVSEFTPVWNDLNNLQQDVSQVESMLKTKFKITEITRQQFHNLIRNIN